MKQFQKKRRGSADQQHIEPRFEEEPHRANLTCPPRLVDETTRHQSALYYPFHLCHERSLWKLLRHFQALHFRDYMAIQLTPFFGTTAFRNRMGDSHPDLVSAGRLIQGYNTSGPLDADMEASVNRDLADPVWRRLFHEAFIGERRFQRGLFDVSHGIMLGKTVVPGPAALLQLMDPSRIAEPYTVDRIRRLSGLQLALADHYRFQYGLALINTAASGVWTLRIARSHDLCVVTDSRGHYVLLQQSCERDNTRLSNWLLEQS